MALHPRPARPSSSSRRVLGRWKQEIEIADRANRALLALRQLYRGTLDDSLLDSDDVWGREDVPNNLDGDLSRRVLEQVRRLPPPLPVPRQGAAILRLRPAAMAADSQSRFSFNQKLGELRRRFAGGCGRLPDRGETFPAQWDRLALPPPGSRPVRARSVSP